MERNIPAAKTNNWIYYAVNWSMPLVRTYRKELFLLMLFSVGMNLVRVNFVQSSIDAVLVRKAGKLLLAFGLFIVIHEIYLCSVGSDSCNCVCSQPSCGLPQGMGYAGLWQKSGGLAAKKLLDYRYSVYEGYGTGELITRLRDNLGVIPHIYTESVFRLLLGIFYGGGAVAVMVTSSWQFSIVVILLCVLESFLMKKGAEKITKKEEALQKLTDRQYQLLIDMVKNLSFIRIASVSNRMRRRYRKASEESAGKALEIGRVQIVLSLLEDGFEALNLLLIFSMGVCLYLAGGIDLGSVLSFLYLQDGIKRQSLLFPIEKIY